MRSYYYLNEDHTYEPCDLSTYANQIEELWETGKKNVAQDIINGKRVSTVWLGLDHNYLGGNPLLLETMVFETEDIGADIYCERYSTWDEAVEGHKRAIQWVLDGCKDDEEGIKELIDREQKMSFLIGFMYGGFNELKEESFWRDDQRIRVDDLFGNIEKMIDDIFYKDKTN